MKATTGKIEGVILEILFDLVGMITAVDKDVLNVVAGEKFQSVLNQWRIGQGE